MSAYGKYIWAWIGVFAAALSCGLGAVTLSAWFAALFLGVVFGGGILLRRIACPKCGTPVCYDGAIRGRRFYDAFIHRECRQCGWDLDKPL